MIIAAFAQAQNKGQGFEGAEIKLDVGEVRPIYPTDNHQVAAAILLEGRKHLADLAPFDPSVRKALDFLPCLAANGYDVQRKASCCSRLGQHARERTSSGDDPKRAFYLTRFRSRTLI